MRIENRSKIEAWFAGRGWQPFAFQQEAWSAYGEGHSGLIHAPTGVGKTVAAWGGPVLEGLEDGGDPEARVIWLTPLRSLAADTARALSELAHGVGLEKWTVEIRTGDTKASVKARQKRRFPTCLITTPESFTNTRSQTEMWFQALAGARPEWGESLCMHHGSLEREIRTEVERKLSAGEAK